LKLGVKRHVFLDFHGPLLQIGVGLASTEKVAVLSALGHPHLGVRRGMPVIVDLEPDATGL
jgi:hypothetical protein